MPCWFEFYWFFTTQYAERNISSLILLNWFQGYYKLFNRRLFRVKDWKNRENLVKADKNSNIRLLKSSKIKYKAEEFKVFEIQYDLSLCYEKHILMGVVSKKNPEI